MKRARQIFFSHLWEEFKRERDLADGAGKPTSDSRDAPRSLPALQVKWRRKREALVVLGDNWLPTSLSRRAKRREKTVMRRTPRIGRVYPKGSMEASTGELATQQYRGGAEGRTDKAQMCSVGTRGSGRGDGPRLPDVRRKGSKKRKSLC